MPRKPTQYDVARQAGVSQTTVSLVLNNPATPSVPEETRARVFEAVNTLGYVPNITARVLRTSRAFTLACIIPMITNPFYPAFVSGVQEMAEQKGYDVIIFNTHSSAEREARFLQTVQQGRVDGVIGVFFYLRAHDLAALLERAIPVVRLEVKKHAGGDWPLDNIFVDNSAAARAATTYLIHKGYLPVAMVTGPDGPRNARRDGYLQALAEGAGGQAPILVEAGAYDEEGGYAAMRRLLAREAKPPGGLFAANDLMAIGAIRALREAGLRVPRDVAVAGFDDIPAARLIEPPLTTIHQDQVGIGRRAAELLIERLEGRAPPGGRSVEMPFTLVARGSA